MISSHPDFVKYWPLIVEEFLAVAVVAPVSMVNIHWVDPKWMYWIGKSAWTPPGGEGWTTGDAQTTKFTWGNVEVGVSPKLAPESPEVDIDFMHPKKT